MLAYLFCMIIVCLVLGGMQRIMFSHTRVLPAPFSESTGYRGKCCVSDVMHYIAHGKTVSNSIAVGVEVACNHPEG